MRLPRAIARPLAMRGTLVAVTAHYRLYHEIASGPDEPCYLGVTQTDDGDRAVVLRVVPAGAAFELAPVPDPFGAFEQLLDIGICELGAVRISRFVYGASVAELGALSWPVARCLYDAFAEPLAFIHEDGSVHGALTARRLRIALEDHPVRLIAPQQRKGDRAAQLHELAILARAICEHARHPDPEIAALLEPDAHGVLRDLLLERGAPVDSLLAGLCAISELPCAASDPPDDGELASLWRHANR